MKKSSKRISDLEKDISYCIDVLGLNNEQIGMVFRCAEELGTSQFNISWKNSYSTWNQNS
jgi:hypothetical protein